MKKVISLLLVFAMLLSTMSAVFASSTTEYKTGKEITITLGENNAAGITSTGGVDYIMVPVKLDKLPEQIVDHASSVAAIEFKLTYDSAKLTFNSILKVIKTYTPAATPFDDPVTAQAAWTTPTPVDGVGTLKTITIPYVSMDDARITKDTFETAEGVLCKVLFQVNSGAGGQTDIVASDMTLRTNNSGNDIRWTEQYFDYPTCVATISEVTKYDITKEGSNYTTTLPVGEKVKAAGDPVEFTVTADTGYQIDSVVVNEGAVDVTGSGSGPYSFVMPAGNANVVINASKIQHTITNPGTFTNGSVVAPPTAGMDDEVVLEVTPASADYVLKSLTVTGPNGVVPVIDNKFTMPNGNVTIDAVFVSNVATLSAITVNGAEATIDDTNATVELPEYAANAAIVVTKDSAEATAEFTNEVVLVEGNNIVTINVTAEDGVTTKTYTLTIVNPADQTVIATADLITVDGVEAPINGLNATITLGEYAESAIVAVETTVDGATVTGDGEVALVEGENTVEIVVTALDGATTETYTLTIVNPENPATIATVESITVNGVGAEIDGTNATVALDVYSEGMAVVVVVDTTVDGATVVINGGNDIALVEGDAVEVDVVVTALDGATTETYTLTISTEADPFAHDATIKSITVNGKPATIDGLNATVALSVYAETATVVVDTTVDDATVKINGVAGKTVTEDIYVGETVYNIVVIATDGVTEEEYTLTVKNPEQKTAQHRPSSSTGGAAAPTLNDVKDNVSDNIDKATDSINKDEYSEEAWAEIEKLIEDAKAELENAKNVKEAEKIEKELLEAIEAVKTLEEEAEDKIPVDETVEPAVIPAPEKSAEELAVAEALYSDMAGHWALAYIHELSVVNNVFKGNEDGTFAPDKGITRQEIAVALGRLLGLEEIAAEVTATDFTDDGEIADWAKGYVAVMNELGLLKGYADGSFGAEDVITREQLALILSRMVEAPEAVAGMAFDDAEGISDWAAEGCAIAYTFGIVKGYPDNTFKGANTVTRAEAVVMIYNYLAAIAE